MSINYIPNTQRKPKGFKRKSRNWGWNQELAKQYNGNANPQDKLPSDSRRHEGSQFQHVPHFPYCDGNDDYAYRGYLPRRMDSPEARRRVGTAIAEGKAIALGCVAGVYTVEQILAQWHRSLRRNSGLGVHDKPCGDLKVRNGAKRKTNATLKTPLNRAESSYKLW